MKRVMGIVRGHLELYMFNLQLSGEQGANAFHDLVQSEDLWMWLKKLLFLLYRFGRIGRRLEISFPNSYAQGLQVAILLLLTGLVLVIPYIRYTAQKQGRGMNIRRIRRPVQGRYLLYLPILFMTAFYLVPMYVLLVTGFKAFDEVSLETMWTLPRGIHFDNYLEAFTKLAPHLWNSLNMVVPAAIIFFLHRVH